MSKKLFLLALAFASVMISLSAGAATLPKGVAHNPPIGSTFTVDSIKYKLLRNNEVEVAGYISGFLGHDTIPSYTYSISERGKRHHMAIPSTVTFGDISYKVVRIGKRAFYDFGSAYTHVTIPNTVTEIKDEAFARSGISSIFVPGSVKRIGADAFVGCSFSRHAYISDLEHWLGITFVSVTSNPMCHIDGVGDNDFYNNKGSLFLVENGESKLINELKIPTSADSICDYVFAGITGIDTCEIGNNVKYIGEKAFFNLRANDLILGDSIKEIADEAFRYALPKRVHASMEAWLNIDFKGEGSNPVSSVDRFYRPIKNPYYYGRPSEIAELYLDGVLAENIVIPKSIHKINNYTFLGNRNLKSIVADSVRVIGRQAFDYCESLKTFKFGEKIDSIAEYAFRGCTKLGTQRNDSVRHIGHGAFSGCESLYVTPTGNNIAVIEEDAFNDCHKNLTATIGSKIKKLEENCMKNLSKLNIEDLVAWLNADVHEEWYYLKNLYVGGEAVDSTLVIPDGVPVLKPRNMFAFRNFCPHIIISKEVTSIADSTFFIWYQCLKSITMLGTVPPSAVENSFLGFRYANSQYKHVYLIVPEEAREAYLKTYPWYLFTKFSGSGVDDVERNGAAVRVNVSGCEMTVDGAAANAVVEVYSAGGQLVYKGTDTTFTVPYKGIYIVRVGGKAIKVAV